MPLCSARFVVCDGLPRWPKLPLVRPPWLLVQPKDFFERYKRCSGDTLSSDSNGALGCRLGAGGQQACLLLFAPAWQACPGCRLVHEQQLPGASCPERTEPKVHE